MDLPLFRTRFLIHNRRARWVIRICALILLLTVVAGHPWLVVGVAEWQLKSAGGQVEGGRDVSYRQIVWREMSWSNEEVSLSAERIELGLIPQFLATWFSPREAAVRGDLFFTATGVDITVRDTTDSEELVPDPPAWHRQASDLVAVAERWLPPVAVRDLQVHSAFFEASAQSVIWDGFFFTMQSARIEPREEVPLNPSHAAFDAAISRAGTGLSMNINGYIGPWADLIADFRTVGSGTGLSVDGEVAWRGGELIGGAQWEQQGWMPETAEAHGMVRQFTGTPLDRDDLPEAALRMDFGMRGGDFDLALEGSGIWLSADPEVGETPWNVSIVAAADPDLLQVGTLQVHVPWLTAELDQPLTIVRETLTPLTSAALRWETELGSWPWLVAQGIASGAAEFSPRAESGLTFAVVGEVDARGVELLPEIYQNPGPVAFTVTGEGDRGLLRISQLEVDAEHWGKVKATGRWDESASDRIAGQVEATAFTAALQPWLPDEIRPGAPLKITTSFAGWEGSWEHEGSLAVYGTELVGSVPLQLDIAWQGSESTLYSWHILAASSRNALALRGSAGWSTGHYNLTLEELEETHGEALRWSLQEPVTLSVTTGDAFREMTLSPLRLENLLADGRLEVAGQFDSADVWSGRVLAHGFGAEAINGWYPIPNDQWLIEHVEIVGKAHDHVILGTAAINGLWRTRAGQDWRARINARLGEERVEILESDISSPTARWFYASGALPLVLRWHEDLAAWRPDLRGDQNFRADFQVSANEPLPGFFAKYLPVEYNNLTIAVQLGGTPEHLEGALALTGNELTVLVSETERLRLLDPELHGTVQGGKVNLDTIGFRLEDAEARAAASLVVDAISWNRLVRGDFAETLAAMRAQLRLDAFPLGAVSPFLPEVLEPSGTISADLSKEGAAELNGRVSWQNINLRPLPNGSVPRNIRGEARLVGQRIEGIDLRANVSGRAIRASGYVEWPREGGFEPLFDLNLQADRLDLVRQLDLILRARGEFRLQRRSLEETPLISGSLILEESLLLRDLRDFTRPGTAGVSRRPPYFAVEVEPFTNWRLNLGIRGDEFMRVRTPVFDGLLSADFRLEGTLGNPILVGDATIDEGNVLFPFARIPLSMGGGSISLSDPHTLQLYAQGRGVAFGYDLVLQLDGTAQNPELTLSSPQGLAQDEIILMLATGAVPTSAGGSSAAARAGRMALYFGQDYISALLGGGGGDGSSRIEMRSGDGFSPFRRNNQVIEYRFNDKWSVLGEYDDWGDYNVDGKWNVYRY